MLTIGGDPSTKYVTDWVRVSPLTSLAVTVKVCQPGVEVSRSPPSEMVPVSPAMFPRQLATPGPPWSSHSKVAGTWAFSGKDWQSIGASISISGATEAASDASA